jgi:hypothetical protein
MEQYVNPCSHCMQSVSNRRHGCVEIDCLTSNDFAVGGINTSLILHGVRNRATVPAGPFSSRLKSL